MARPGVNYTAVSEAANYLLGQGKTPTIEQVRHVLGTGSSTTLANHLRRWKTNQGNNKPLSKEHLPEELLALIKGLWEQMLIQSEEKIALIENAFQQKMDALLSELQKYKKNNHRWQQLHNLWAEEKNKLRQDKTQAEKIAQQLQQDCSVLAEKQLVLSEQLQEKQERIKELNRLHHQAQANLEHFRASARTQRLIEQQRYETEKKELQTQIKELTKIQLKNKNASLEKQQKNLQKACAMLEKRIADLKALKFSD